jgi:hypothetical protein
VPPGYSGYSGSRKYPQSPCLRTRESPSYRIIIPPYRQTVCSPRYPSQHHNSSGARHWRKRGQMHRDWTFIDDIVSGIVASDHRLGYEVLNLGCGEPVLLADSWRRTSTFAAAARRTPASKKSGAQNCPTVHAS